MILRSRVSNRKSAKDPVPAIVFPNALQTGVLDPTQKDTISHNLFNVLDPRLSLSIEGYTRCGQNIVLLFPKKYLCSNIFPLVTLFDITEVAL